MDVTTHIPDLGAHPLGIELLLNGIKICAFSVCRYGWLELRALVPEALTANSKASGEYELEIRADHTWQPRPTGDETRDDRELSIAVCNITVKSEG